MGTFLKSFDTEFTIPAPSDGVWRLCCAVSYEHTFPRTVLERVKLCWQRKSFAPVRWPTFSRDWYLNSEPITNSVSSAADSPTR
jgi:hypothetical protein